MSDDLPLEPEEQELLRSYERDEWRSVDALREERRRYQAYAIAALEEAGVVSVALPSEDLQALRRKAAEAGMSYQAFIAHILHQYVTGRLVESS